LVTKKVNEEPDVWADDEKPAVVEHMGKPDRDGIVVTSKAGAGFEVPWIVLHATDIKDAIEQLNSDEYTELMDLTSRKAKEFTKAFGGSAGFSKPAATASSGFKKPAAKKPVYDEDSDTYECEHGERTWVTGRSGKGPWQAWMCPADKNDPSKCDPLWANKDGSLQNR
jgi:hypothetical protein